MNCEFNKPLDVPSASFPQDQMQWESTENSTPSALFAERITDEQYCLPLALELHTHIFSFLDLPSILNAEQVCRAFHQVINDSYLFNKKELISDFLINYSKEMTGLPDNVRKSKLIAEMVDKDLSWAKETAVSINHNLDKAMALLEIAKKQVESDINAALETLEEASKLFNGETKASLNDKCEFLRKKSIVQAHFDLEAALKTVESMEKSRLTEKINDKAKLKISLMHAQKNPSEAIKIAEKISCREKQVKALCGIAEVQRQNHDANALETLNLALKKIELPLSYGPAFWIQKNSGCANEN